MSLNSSVTRRSVIQNGALLSSALFTTPGLFADELMRTPAMTEGPFYPDRLPLDQDNDLFIVGNSTTPAVGEITHLTGRIMSASGEPIRNATIEIWQCDAKQVYLHTRDSGPKSEQQDKNFQGFGRFETNAKGEYRFRTIKPVPYPGRPSPHIHFKVLKGDRELLTSQIFIAGHAGQKSDGVFRGLSDFIDRELVETEFKAIEGSRIGELSANFDIIVGRTPNETALKRRAALRNPLA